MPLCTLHLLALSTSLPSFLASYKTHYASQPPSAQPLVLARVVRWIITPTHNAAATLLSTPWDLLLILPADAPLPPALAALVKDSYRLTAGVPSKLTSDFHARNARLLRPPPASVPALTGALDEPLLAPSAQSLELTPALREWLGAHDPQRTRGAVSMLNLLAFKPGMLPQYQKYGAAFAESIGSRRGGQAKIVGKVVAGGADGSGDAWEEVALAHYPSVWHFADMAASKDYQAVNREYRVGSLSDTCILCTSEVDLGDELEKGKL